MFDRTFRTVANDPANFPGVTNNGYPYLDLYQEYGTLELNYRPASYLTLTSTSGYYRETAPSSVNAISTAYAGLRSLPVTTRLDTTSPRNCG